MSKMRLLLVVTKDGEDADKVASRYDKTVDYGERCVFPAEFADERREEHIEKLRSLLDDPPYKMSDPEKARVVDTLKRIRRMTPEEYLYEMTEGCVYDEEGNAYKNDNPNGRYSYPKCYQSEFDATGEEAVFSSPFKLLDGTKSYVARKKDIDWSEMHMAHTSVYDRVWSICVEGDEPASKAEKKIAEAMNVSGQYFSSFMDKNEYIVHNTAFFMWGVVGPDGLVGFRRESDDPYDWESKFYSRYVEPLDDDDILSIYEVVV